VLTFSPTGKPIHPSITNKNSKDNRWSSTPVPWVGCVTASHPSPSELQQSPKAVPQTPRGNRRFQRTERLPERTKERIAQDIAAVLNAPADWLSPRAKNAVLKNAIWAWTQFDGKYKGCKTWSQAA